MVNLSVNYLKLIMNKETHLEMFLMAICDYMYMNCSMLMKKGVFFQMMAILMTVMREKTILSP